MKQNKTKQNKKEQNKTKTKTHKKTSLYLGFLITYRKQPCVLALSIKKSRRQMYYDQRSTRS